MKFIIGMLVVTGSVVGGYVLSHGHLAVLFQPFEFLIIFGAATGAFIASNPGVVIKQVLGSIPLLLKGSKYNKQSYLDLLALMYELFSKARKEGLMALENDIEEPKESAIFSRYPKIQADHHAVDFICDYLRLMVGGSMNSMELENLMDLELETHHEESHLPSHAVTTMSDGLPAFGIVAAVLGVVITMGSLSEPPEVLGMHIGAALVGTFLGILLAYGYVGPIGTFLGHIKREESKFLECIKICIMATLNGYTPQVAVEFGRKALYSNVRPGFLELEEYVKSAGKS
ncbi:MAG: flagellar motor stator protein MotA [Gammaproteobacteria bacterium]|nr:flagellar motor stator protein MotA [Gammaproteobacteria bacterium]